MKTPEVTKAVEKAIAEQLDFECAGRCEAGSVTGVGEAATAAITAIESATAPQWSCNCLTRDGKTYHTEHCKNMTAAATATTAEIEKSKVRENAWKECAEHATEENATEENARLREALELCLKAIKSVEEKAVFGVRGGRDNRWYLVDELIAKVTAALSNGG